MSRQRFKPTDAFVDKSIRGQRYLMGCVLVEAKTLPAVRPAVEELALFGNRIHFHNESNGVGNRSWSCLRHCRFKSTSWCVSASTA